jgi:carbon starvation protein
MTVFALIVQLKDFYNSGDWFLMGLDLVVLVAAIWIALEASAGLTKIRKEQKAQKQQ